VFWHSPPISERRPYRESAAADTSTPGYQACTLIVGAGQARRDAPPAAGRAWVHRLPCSDTWSVTPVYALFAQLTSPASENTGALWRWIARVAPSSETRVRAGLQGLVFHAGHSSRPRRSKNMITEGDQIGQHPSVRTRTDGMSLWVLDWRSLGRCARQTPALCTLHCGVSRIVRKNAPPIALWCSTEPSTIGQHMLHLPRLQALGLLSRGST
jgi:hypothetical protein